MGALHSGHVSLVAEAKKCNSLVVASIFVNPTQFGKGEDLDKYPRTFDKDLAMLREAGVACIFAPSTEVMYPPGDDPPLCHVEPAAFGAISEGQARPNFFRGVATVVTKLFNIVQPTTAYFGQKDVAQCVLIQRMVRDLSMPVRIQVCPTLREADGLAMSSRNTYLQPSERPAAGVLYRALSAAKMVCEGGAVGVSRDAVIDAAKHVLHQEPLVTQIEYISVASPDNMRELPIVRAEDQGAVISAAVRLGSVRLIDNLLVGRAISRLLPSTHAR